MIHSTAILMRSSTLHGLCGSPLLGSNMAGNQDQLEQPVTPKNRGLGWSIGFLDALKNTSNRPLKLSCTTCEVLEQLTAILKPAGAVDKPPSDGLRNRGAMAVRIIMLRKLWAISIIIQIQRRIEAEGPRGYAVIAFLFAFLAGALCSIAFASRRSRTSSSFGSGQTDR